MLQNISIGAKISLVTAGEQQGLRTKKELSEIKTMKNSMRSGKIKIKKKKKKTQRVEKTYKGERKKIKFP